MSIIEVFNIANHISLFATQPWLFLNMHLRNNLGTAKVKLNYQAILKRDKCAWLKVKRKGIAQQGVWEIVGENSQWEWHTWGCDFAYLNDLFWHKKNKYLFKNYLEPASSVSFKRVLRNNVILFYKNKKICSVGLNVCFEKQPSHSFFNGKL